MKARLWTFAPIPLRWSVRYCASQEWLCGSGLGPESGALRSQSHVTLTSLSNIRATTPIHLRRAPQASAHRSAHRCWAPPTPAPIVKGPPLPWTLRPYSSPFFSPALTAAARLTMETLHRMSNRLQLHQNPVPARSLQLACSPSCGSCPSGDLFS